MKKIASVGILALVLGLSFMASAQVSGPPETPVTIERIVNILSTFINWLFAILLALAVIFIILAAFKYLTAGGDAEKIKSAHTQLIYALVSLGVALLSRGLIYLVKQLLGIS
jgi:hypothetical protein